MLPNCKLQEECNGVLMQLPSGCPPPLYSAHIATLCHNVHSRGWRGLHRYGDPPLPIISILFTLSNLKSALLVQIGLSVLTANPDEPFRGQHSWLKEEQDQKALKKC